MKHLGLPMQTASFYGFRPKNIRSPSQNRTFLVRKPYGFGTENVKGRQIETDSIPFNHTLVHSLLNKLSQIANLIYTPRFSLNNASI